MEHQNEFQNDLKLILTVLDLSESAFAEEVGVNTPTVSNWLKGKYLPDPRSKEEVYRFAYEQGLFLNLAHEEPFRELCRKQNLTILYHGAKEGIDGEISLDRSKPFNDLGKGFYCGEYFSQAALFVSGFPRSSICSFSLKTKGLKIREFHINPEWMLVVAYYRGFLEEYHDSAYLKKLLRFCEKADVIIAPIADNRMFDLIAGFCEGRMTCEACAASLAALDLGRQYVLKTDKAISQLEYMKEFYLCKKEKNTYSDQAIERYKERSLALKDIQKKYRNGRYIDEVLYE